MRYLVAFLICSVATFSAAGSQSHIYRLSHGWLLPVTDKHPPVRSHPGWQPITLPDIWTPNHVGGAGPVWYRFEFMLHQTPQQKWAIYLPVVDTNAELWLNGIMIGAAGRFDRRSAHNWNRPLYYRIPRRGLREGINVLQLRFLPRTSQFGKLAVIRVGAEKKLKPEYELAYMFRISIPRAFSILLLAFSVFIGVIWLKRRQESLYGWFAGASLSWGFFNFNMVLHEVPFKAAYWDALVFIALGWFVIILTIFFHRFWDITYPKFERTILIAGSVGSLALFLTADRYFYTYGQTIWDNVLMLLSFYLIWAVASNCIKHSKPGGWILFLACILLVAFGIHDNLVQLTIWNIENVRLLPYASPLLLVVVAWMLLIRFVNAMNEAEILNQTLDMKVSEREKELEHNYKILKRLEKEKVIADERERIMTDMHDGLGGYLVSAMAIAENCDTNSEALKYELQRALEDLRMMIDSFDPVEDNLVFVLAMLRSRLEPRLRRSKISLNWNVNDLPPMKSFGAEKILQLMRIMEEGVTNVIKHSHATSLTMSTSMRRQDWGNWIVIDMRDNGTGMKNTVAFGRGLANMHRRADRIEAKLEVKSDSGGTSVQIVIPTVHR